MMQTRVASGLSCAQQQTRILPTSRPAGRARVAPIVAFRDNKRSSSSPTKGGSKQASAGGKQGKKQAVVQPLGKAPSNSKENAESIVWFVAVAGLFLTGVLFVTIPAFQLGGNAFTKTWQRGLNKTVGIKEPVVAAQEYAPAPGPAAAPGTPATQQ